MTPIRYSLLLMLWLASGIGAAEPVSNAVEGIHYTKVQPAQPTAAGASKVEVMEFFWYGCPHCFRFEPYIKGWLQKQPDNVVFRRMPTVLNPNWETHARAFFAAEIMGVTEKIHEPLFIALHVDQKRIFSEQEILDFVENLGVDRQQFAETYRSFTVNAKLRESKGLSRAAGLNGVPAIMVNGKYLTSAMRTGSFEALIALLEQFVKAEMDAAAARSK